MFENDLFQLIQYAPLTAEGGIAAARDRPALHQQVLHPRPAAGELVRPLCERARPHGLSRLVAQPWTEQGNTTWDDYIEHGAMKAVEVTKAIAGAEKVNAVGGVSAARSWHPHLPCSARGGHVGRQHDPADDHLIRRSGRSRCLHRRAGRRSARANDRQWRDLPGVGTRLRLPDAARERLDLALCGQQLPQRESRPTLSTCSIGTPTAPTFRVRCTPGTCGTRTWRTTCRCPTS